MRPRIRTLKPEIWEDERVGDLSHGARLLFIGLITMADDEGRLRELPATILGHVFPYDEVTAAKLARWLREVESTGMVVRYVAAGKRYLAFRRWARHQRVDKPNRSDLPEPPKFPDGSPNGSGNGRGAISDSFEDQSRPLRRGADPIRSDPVVDFYNDNGLGHGRRAPTKRVDQNEPPIALPDELHGTAHSVLAILVAVQAERGGDVPTIRGVGLAILRFENRDFMAVVRELEHWALAGRGARKPVKDWARTYATFLGNTPEGAAPRLRLVPGRESASDILRALDGDAS